MSGHGEKLTRKKEAAIAALLSSPTIAVAAAKAGVSEPTIKRWLKQTEFSEAFGAARERLIDSTLLDLQRTSSEAVETLRRNLTCGKASIEIRAAATLLNLVLRYGELADLEARIRRVEEAQAGVANWQSRSQRRRAA